MVSEAIANRESLIDKHDLICFTDEGHTGTNSNRRTRYQIGDNTNDRLSRVVPVSKDWSL